MILELDRDSHTPLYAQIAIQIRGMITGGALKVGDRLPANRELSKVLGVNRTTVNTAYEELLADGLIESHVGRGTFISAIPSPPRRSWIKEPAPPPPIQWGPMLAGRKPDQWLSGMPRNLPAAEAVSLAFALPSPELFPIEEFRRSVDRVLRKEGSALLDHGSAAGYRPLREYVAQQASLSGRAVAPEQVLITSGCQQALSLIRQVLVRPGDEVIFETPTYPGALSVFCGYETKYSCIPVNEGGIDLVLLEEALAQRRPRLIYTIPSFHNPTGVTMDLASRRKLLDLALKYRVPIVEDDIYGELRYDGPSLPSLKALDEYGVVIYINSFSKIGFPGIRVGWIIADKTVIDALTVTKRANDLHTTLLSQAAIFEFSRRGLLAKHVKRIKKTYANRRDVMLSALEKYFPEEATWTHPEGGLSIWVTLPESINANQILIESMEKGVIFSPGEHFHANLSPANNMRLAFSTTNAQSIEESIKRLGAILKARVGALRKQDSGHGLEALRALV